MVIDNIGKVIRREPVSLYDDIVLLGLGLLVSRVYQIFDLDWCLGALETHSMWFMLAALGLIRRNMTAGSRILGRFSAGMCLLLVPLQVERAAEATVSFVLFYERIGMCCIALKTFRLIEVRRDINGFGRQGSTCLYGP